MINYLVLLICALIVFSIVFLFFKKNNFQLKLMIFGGGFLIAFVGIFIQTNLSLSHSILIMLGLIFALSIVFTKQIEKMNQDVDSNDRLQKEPLKIQEVF